MRIEKKKFNLVKKSSFEGKPEASCVEDDDSGEYMNIDIPAHEVATPAELDHGNS
ncbi:hypothetical protein [Thermoflavimicrobium dichotomicum]|uniref:Uncharacterized protein n=1 Tax=Thermoflavimicrobium dichotomicum TaxID=46223 RepID=A0A1I3T9X9_9BACL|nr:hypothetical protein [Thermoflavimicrobium dichotomicum]SFJ67129.1 hypothetical protein SAMN05421852_11653 [Thermoflavimicrobium dichotomicum]